MRVVIKVPQTALIPIIMVIASGTDEAKNCARWVNPRLAVSFEIIMRIVFYDAANGWLTASNHKSQCVL